MKWYQAWKLVFGWFHLYDKLWSKDNKKYRPRGGENANNKGERTHGGRRTWFREVVKNYLASEFFPLRGYLPHPLTENHFAKKTLAERGGTPRPFSWSPKVCFTATIPYINPNFIYWLRERYTNHTSILLPLNTIPPFTKCVLQRPSQT